MSSEKTGVVRGKKTVGHTAVGVKAQPVRQRYWEG